MGAGASIEEATAAGTERIDSLFSSLVFGTGGFIDGEVLAGLIAADAEGKEFLSNSRIMALLDRTSKRSANISKEEFAAFWGECLKVDGTEATDALVTKTEAMAAKLAADAVNKSLELSAATETSNAAAAPVDPAAPPAEVAAGGGVPEGAATDEGGSAQAQAQATAQATALLELKSSVAEGSFDVSGWDASKPLAEWGCGVTVSTDSGLVERLDLGAAKIYSKVGSAFDVALLGPLLTSSLRFLKLLDLDCKGDLSLVASQAPELREVWLTGKGLVGDVKALGACKSLARVKLRSTGVTGDVCDFAEHKRLTVLWLEDSGVTGKAGALKAELPKCDVSMGSSEEE